MKKVVWLALSIVLVFGFAITEAMSEQIILKAVTPFPKNNLSIESVPIYVEKVNKAAKGRLKIDWVGGPEVMKGYDQIHALKGGTIDMILIYPFAYMKPLMPEAYAKGLTELAEWEERKTGAFELWSEIFAKRVNAKYIGRLNNLVPFQIFSNKKIQKIEDFKGLKIRVMPLYVPFVEALGAAPVTTQATEIYTSMERGIVDAFLWPNIGVISWGLHEVSKYVIRPGVFQIEPATMINMDKWKKIPKDLQAIVMELMEDMEFISTTRNFLIMEKEENVRKKAGMQDIVLPPADAEKFRKICYDKTWEYVIKMAPENGPKLRELSSKKALPKGTFPWQ